jgi:hypothetical protein
VQGANIFKAKVNIEVQWASEPVIAAIERNGGVITTAYYDVHSLWAVINPKKFFSKGKSQSIHHSPFSIILYMKTSYGLCSQWTYILHVWH